MCNCDNKGPGINSPEVEQDLKTLADLIRDGGLGSIDPTTLTRLLNALCIARTGDTTNALHIVQGLVVNHEQMARHITKLDTANGETQKWFIRLAIASLIGTAVQAFVAAAFYFGHPSVSRSDEQTPSEAVQTNTQQHDAACKVDQAKTTPPPAKQ